MKKYLMAAAAAFTCAFAGVSTSSAQTALFIYNDGSGTPNQGTYFAGQSFTFSIDIAFTSGGTVANLDGLSYWFQQVTPAGAPFNFAITLRDVNGPAVAGVAGPSPFTDLQTPGLTYPQNLNPSGLPANDLGAAQPYPGPAGLGNGTYFVANITISIAPTALNGTYFIGNTTSGGVTSVISDDQGDTFAIPQALYEIDVVPEPSTWLAGALALAALLASQRRRFVRLRQSA